jgi:hypothetical protein
MQVSSPQLQQTKGGDMTQHKVRITAVRKEEVDVERLVAGLLLLLHELADTSNSNNETDPADGGTQ